MAAWAAVFGFGLAGCFAGVPSAARALRVCALCAAFLRWRVRRELVLPACVPGGGSFGSPFLLRYAAASVWCSCLAAVRPSLLVAFSLYFCAGARIFRLILQT